jgi:hypothetical protein
MGKIGQKIIKSPIILGSYNTVIDFRRVYIEPSLYFFIENTLKQIIT